MILVDTSVWIDHFHRSEPELVSLLERNDVTTHEMVIGELALGSIAQRSAVLDALHSLRCMVTVSHDELTLFVEAHALFGRGLSLVDAHLLAAATATPGTALWTRDRRLRERAADLGVAWMP